MRIRLLTLIVFLSSFSFGQQLYYTRTVSGNLFLPPGTPAANSKMRFQLKYCGGQNGRVPVNPGNPPGPTGLIVSSEPFDVNVSSDGTWKTQIYGNDQIMCGSDASGRSRWLIQPVFNGAAGAGVEYQINSCGPVLNCPAFSPDTAPGCGSANPTPPPPTITTDCAVGGGNPDLPDTTVTVNATMAVPNAINFSNVLLPPANGSVINFLLNGNQAGAYLPGNGNSSTCLSGTGTWVVCGGGSGGGVTGATPNRGLALTGTTLGLITCSTNQYLSWNGSAWVCTTLTGGGGGTFPPTAQYDLFASTGAGAAQASGVLGSNGFVRAQVYTATGDISGNRPAFQLFPNASVEYFPTGYSNAQGNFGAANGLALYMSHSGQSSATGNGGIALGGGNSSGTGNLIYLDCEVAGCDFKVPVSYLGGGLGGGGGANLPSVPQYTLFNSPSTGTAGDSGVFGQAGFLRAYVLESTGAGSHPSPFTVPNGSIEYFPTGGYGAGGANGVALHVSHSGSATGFGGIALAGGNTSGQDQLYLDCEGPPVVPALGCDFKVPITVNGAAVGGGGGGGGVNPATVGQFASYNTTTTVAGNAHLSDDGTTITATEPIAAPSFITTTPNVGFSAISSGGTLPTPAAGQGGIGIGQGGVPQFYPPGGPWTNIGTGGTSGTVTWGSIPTTPALSTQTDLQAALNSKIGTGSTLTPTTCTVPGQAATGITATGAATGCFTPGGAGAVNPIVFAGATLSTPPGAGNGGFGVIGAGYPAVANGGSGYKIVQQPSEVNGVQFGTAFSTNFVGSTASPCGGLTIPTNGTCINFIAGGTNTGSVAAALVGDGSNNCLSGHGTYVICGTSSGGGVTGATPQGGLLLQGQTLGLQTCTANQYLFFDGNTWVCAPVPSPTSNNPILDTGITLPATTAGQGGIGIATGGIPSLNTGASSTWAPIAYVTFNQAARTLNQVNFSNGSPVAPTWGRNITWNTAGGANTSAALVGDGSTNCLSGQGIYVSCGGVTGATPGMGLLLTGGSTLGLTNTCTDGQVLQYNGSTSQWVCTTPTTGGAVNSGTQGQLAWYSATGNTVSGSPDLSDSGTAITSTKQFIMSNTTPVYFQFPNFANVAPTPVNGVPQLGVYGAGGVTGAVLYWSNGATTASNAFRMVATAPLVNTTQMTTQQVTFTGTAPNTCTTTNAPQYSRCVAFWTAGPNTGSISGGIVGDGNASNCLNGTGNYSPCSGGAAGTLTCTLSADASFVSGNICTQALGATAKQWIVHCAIPWNFTGGSGTATVNIGFNLTVAPTITPSYVMPVMWSSTAASNMGAVQLNAAAGNTNIVTASLAAGSGGTIFQIIIDGTIPAAANTTFSVFGSLSGGTSPTAAFRPGFNCVLQ